MKKQLFDQGLISVFRLFTAIRLCIALLGLGTFFLLRGPGIGFEPQNILTIFETIIVLIMLSFRWFETKMGRWFLPAALSITTIGALAASIPLSYSTDIPIEIIQARTIMGQWQSIITLLMPLILISWQYGFSSAVGFSIILDFLNLAVLTLMNPIAYGHPFIMASILFFRTLFYLLIAYTITRLAAELRSQNSRLEQANRQLARSAIAQEQLAVSRERNRMARELHDTLAHTMSGMAVQLEAAESIWETKPDDSRQIVRSALSLTRQGLNEARRAIHALRAAPIEDMGLLLALQNMARNEAERGGLTLNLDLPEKIQQLPNEVEHALYRIAEEALRNAVHHADAKSITFSLACFHDHLTMMIKDDGEGFDTSKNNYEERFGLQGMYERVEAMNGQIEINSLPGKGTTVTLSMEISS